MSKGKYENVASADDYGFADPTGKYMEGMDRFTNMANYGRRGMENYLDPNMAYNAFMSQAPGLSQLASGATSPLTQQLNAIATQQANQGIANAGTQFAGKGALYSGAASRAFGEASASPFAQVAAQQQQNQLNLTGQLWNQGFGGAQNLQNMGANLYGNIYGQGMQGYGNMAMNTGGVVAPQYEYKKGFGDYLGGAVNTGLGLATAAGGLGWKPFSPAEEPPDNALPFDPSAIWMRR